MSKHNNNLGPSSKALCKCGRYATLGEDAAGFIPLGEYECPDCFKARVSPMTKEEYYKGFLCFGKPC